MYTSIISVNDKKIIFQDMVNIAYNVRISIEKKKKEVSENSRSELWLAVVEGGEHQLMFLANGSSPFLLIQKAKQLSRLQNAKFSVYLFIDIKKRWNKWISIHIICIQKTNLSFQCIKLTRNKKLSALGRSPNIAI